MRPKQQADTRFVAALVEHEQQELEEPKVEQEGAGQEEHLVREVDVCLGDDHGWGRSTKTQVKAVEALDAINLARSPSMRGPHGCSFVGARQALMLY
jgi:hypothetical protein